MSFPKYDRYKESGVEWLGEVPEHWETCRNKALFYEVDERSSENAGELLTVSHLTGVTPRSEKNVNMFLAETLEGYKKCKAGDLVINTMWAWMGALGISPCDGLVSPSYNVYRFRESEKASPRYFDFLIRIPSHVVIIKACSTGVWESRLRLYPNAFFSVGICVPPLPEQRSIATFLDRETAKIDELITEQQRLIDLLKEKRQAVISHAVTKGLNPDAPMKETAIEWLGDVPEHWEVLRLGSLATAIQTGPFGSQLHSEDYVDGETPVINPSNIQEGKLIADESCTVPIEIVERLSHHVLKAGDVVFGRRGEMGRCAMVTDCEVGWICGTGCLNVRLGKKVLPEFITTYLGTSYIREKLKLESVGSTMDNLNTSILSAILLVTPPLEEQQQIVTFLERATTEIDELISEAQHAIALLQERRTALISAAVTGKIDVRNLVAPHP
jgi:type I restriction enzyme, S subunit